MLDENDAESIKYEPLKIAMLELFVVILESNDAESVKKLLLSKAILELFIVILEANDAEPVWYVNGLPVIS